MSLLNARPGTPLHLAGTAYQRGRAQATLCPNQASFVRAAVATRLAAARDALAIPEVQALIHGQREYTERYYPAILEEMQGIADGFSLGIDTLFEYLHCAIASDLAWTAEHVPEGCTSFAAAHEELGAIVVKNRDYRPEHIPIQRVFHHTDPTWNGHEIICVGSLGSPGNFSSGINSDGLAITDTNSRTSDHGVGMNRYFLLTWILVHCATVAEALDGIRGMSHTGGGLLILGDAGGNVAAVELGHRSVGIEKRSGSWVGRANHFVSPTMAAANLRTPFYDASDCNSERRHATLQTLLSRRATSLDAAGAAAIAAYHGGQGDEHFCRHGGADLGHTISCSLYATRAPSLAFTDGNPCTPDWRAFSFQSRSLP